VIQPDVRFLWIFGTGHTDQSIDALPLGSLLGTFIDDFGIAVSGLGPAKSRQCGSPCGCYTRDNRSDDLTVRHEAER
jgi:hypothetical protein